MNQNLRDQMTFEKKQWSVKKDNRKHSVFFQDVLKNTLYTYKLQEKETKITGVYQCSLTDFLIFVESKSGKSGFERITFPGEQESNYRVIYSFSSEEGYMFLDDNFILLLSTPDLYLFDISFGIYDIANNKKLQLTSFIDFEIRKYFKNEDIIGFLEFIKHSDLSFKKSGKDYYLYCEKKIHFPNTFPDYLQVLFDADTFKPALPVFSTLRGSLIDFSNYSYLEELLSEEFYYKSVVSKNLEAITSSLGKKGKAMLLKAFLAN